jgi:hypothetical protein
VKGRATFRQSRFASEIESTDSDCGSFRGYDPEGALFVWIINEPISTLDDYEPGFLEFFLYDFRCQNVVLDLVGTRSLPSPIGHVVDNDKPRARLQGVKDVPDDLRIPIQSVICIDQKHSIQRAFRQLWVVLSAVDHLDIPETAVSNPLSQVL